MTARVEFADIREDNLTVTDRRLAAIHWARQALHPGAVVILDAETTGSSGGGVRYWQGRRSEPAEWGAALCRQDDTPTGAMIMSSVSAWWAELESPGRLLPEPAPRRAARSASMAQSGELRRTAVTDERIHRPPCERERPDTTSADDVDPRTGRRTAERAMTQHAAVVHQMITATTEMLLISDPAIPAVHAELRYLCDDPFAVQMLLSIEQSPAICWILSRDLLITGAAMPSGVGDVQVYPTHDGVIIELRSGVYVVALLAYAPDVTEFIARTLAVVPVGAELDRHDTEGELALLLPSATPTKHDRLSASPSPLENRIRKENPPCA